MNFIYIYMSNYLLRSILTNIELQNQLYKKINKIITNNDIDTILYEHDISNINALYLCIQIISINDNNNSSYLSWDYRINNNVITWIISIKNCDIEMASVEFNISKDENNLYIKVKGLENENCYFTGIISVLIIN